MCIAKSSNFFFSSYVSQQGLSRGVFKKRKIRKEVTIATENDGLIEGNIIIDYIPH